MIGLVVITHGGLAQEFQRALEHIIGPQSYFQTLSIYAQDDVQQCREALIAAIRNVENGFGTIILTDMFGGTPSNIALSLMEEGKIEVITGVNLPMLVKLASIRKSDSIHLMDALYAAQEAGQKYINVPSIFLLN